MAEEAQAKQSQAPEAQKQTETPAPHEPVSAGAAPFADDTPEEQPAKKKPASKAKKKPAKKKAAPKGKKAAKGKPGEKTDQASRIPEAPPKPKVNVPPAPMRKALVEQPEPETDPNWTMEDVMGSEGTRDELEDAWEQFNSQERQGHMVESGMAEEDPEGVEQEEPSTAEEQEENEETTTVQDDETEELGEGEEQQPSEPEEEKVYAKKFKSVEALEEGYHQAEKQMHASNQVAAMLRQQNELLQQQIEALRQQAPATTPAAADTQEDPQEEDPDFWEDPKAAAEAIAQRKLDQYKQEQAQIKAQKEQERLKAEAHKQINSFLEDHFTEKHADLADHQAQVLQTGALLRQNFAERFKKDQAQGAQTNTTPQEIQFHAAINAGNPKALAFLMDIAANLYRQANGLPMPAASSESGQQEQTTNPAAAPGAQPPGQHPPSAAAIETRTPLSHRTAVPSTRRTPAQKGRKPEMQSSREYVDERQAQGERMFGIR